MIYYYLLFINLLVEFITNSEPTSLLFSLIVVGKK